VIGQRRLCGTWSWCHSYPMKSNRCATSSIAIFVSHGRWLIQHADGARKSTASNISNAHHVVTRPVRVAQVLRRSSPPECSIPVTAPRPPYFCHARLRENRVTFDARLHASPRRSTACVRKAKVLAFVTRHLRVLAGVARYQKHAAVQLRRRHLTALVEPHRLGRS
jgi:hypothetical protein